MASSVGMVSEVINVSERGRAGFMTPGQRSYCCVFNVSSSTHNCGGVVDGGNAMAAI